MYMCMYIIKKNNILFVFKKKCREFYSFIDYYCCDESFFF